MFYINMERLSLLLLANHFILKMNVWRCLLNQPAALVNCVTSALAQLTGLLQQKHDFSSLSAPEEITSAALLMDYVLNIKK